MWGHFLPACVMCFRTAAAQQAERSRVLNSGILILLIPPVLIMAGILWMAWRKPGGEPSATGSAKQPDFSR